MSPWSPAVLITCWGQTWLDPPWAEKINLAMCPFAQFAAISMDEKVSIWSHNSSCYNLAPFPFLHLYNQPWGEELPEKMMKSKARWPCISQAGYSSLWNNNVMWLLLGIFWHEKGRKPSKRSVFIADSESPCHLKGGFEFCLLPNVFSLVLEAVTQLLDIVACIR